MKIIFRAALQVVLLLTISNTYCIARNRCMDLYNIHAGYNAFTNITEQAIGFNRDLQYGNIIYKNFPEGNASLKLAGKFIMEFSVRDNHPPIDAILKINNETNGLFLSHLSLCSRFSGDIKYRNYLEKLESEPQYEYFYYQTVIWAYPMRWKGNFENAEEFVRKYDLVRLKYPPLTESEAVLYNLFKIALEWESTKNETEILQRLDSLFQHKRKYLSTRNYLNFIKKYFPDKVVSTALSDTLHDSFDIDRDRANPIFLAYKNEYNSLTESINAIVENPFNTDVFNYSNTRKWLKKESYNSVIKSLDKLNKIESEYNKVCNVPALHFDLIRNILESEELPFNRIQQNELRISILKKWLDFHMACQITTMFYMDKNIIAYWDALPGEDQIKLGAYFEKELAGKGFHNYLVELKNVLKQK